jgi:hypothetical protein
MTDEHPKLIVGIYVHNNTPCCSYVDNVWSIVIVARMTTFGHCFVLANKVLSP